MQIRNLVPPLLAAIVTGVLAVALSHGIGRSVAPASSAAVRGKTARVKIQNYAFFPQTLTVKRGTRITWTNYDDTAHTATADQGAFDTGTVERGHSMTIAFNRPGTYAYHCSFHAFMTGTITVVG